MGLKASVLHLGAGTHPHAHGPWLWEHSGEPDGSADASSACGKCWNSQTDGPTQYLQRKSAAENSTSSTWLAVHLHTAIPAAKEHLCTGGPPTRHGSGASATEFLSITRNPLLGTHQGLGANAALLRTPVSAGKMSPIACAMSRI
ncbi:hypothetical protein AAFF_G00105930 [Aldrovandia affinis]|uniref:Uncharacterized protein n=1 Tax=Aldrovandia affinis TaxID=143900 RepID=A0AAD7T292_9TELE|nr:hypothetical protein AAFF_G00105930 [Aldrovandia affinis]